MDKAVVGPGIASSKGERRGTPDLGLVGPHEQQELKQLIEFNAE